MRDILGDEKADKILNQAAESAAQQAATRKVQKEKRTIVGRFLAVFAGLVWLAMSLLGLLFLACLLRLPTARYEFSRTSDGSIKASLPRMFQTVEKKISVNDFRECVIGRYRNTNRIPTWTWFVQIVPANLVEPIQFKVAEELVAKATDQPPERVVEFQRCLSDVFLERSK